MPRQSEYARVLCFVGLHDDELHLYGQVSELSVGEWFLLGVRERRRIKFVRPKLREAPESAAVCPLKPGCLGP